MSPTAARRAVRYVHFAGAAALGAFIYSPLAADPSFQTFVRFGVVPLLALSGVWLWKQGAISRLLKRGKAP